MRDIKKIGDDIKEALKARDEDRLRALRALKTAIRNKEVELKRPLEEREYIQIVNMLVKQRRESIDHFEKGGRKDLAVLEEEEIKILADYLPPSLSEEELSSIIDQAISESGASTPKDIGKVMKIVMEKIGGRADGRLVNSMTAKKLQMK